MWFDAIADNQKTVALLRTWICLKYERWETSQMSEVSSSQ